MFSKSCAYKKKLIKKWKKEKEAQKAINKAKIFEEIFLSRIQRVFGGKKNRNKDEVKSEKLNKDKIPISLTCKCIKHLNRAYSHLYKRKIISEIE